MKDYLPKDTALLQRIEGILKRVLEGYGYSEIRLPIAEKTSLFKRAIGEMTDVVEKEMYTFNDRNGDCITLRPEGTAGCVRAAIEHGLLYNQEQRLWYIGPMFRYERPQKGRYRQFHQLGAEVFGLAGPDIDAELILLTARCWKTLGIAEHIKLEINCIGSQSTRAHYRNMLITFLEKHVSILDADCTRRMYRNPLRVLDSKNPEMQTLLNDAPRLSQYLDSESSDHFTGLCTLLSQAGISYTINERLVRGLDYYNRTVFEWVTTDIGSLGAVCAGGRYDGLIEQFSGNYVPAIGFAIGLERLVCLVQAIYPDFTVQPTIDIYIVSYGIGTKSNAIQLAEQVREALPNLKLMTNYGKGNFKKQITRADKWGARIALILGENEVVTQKVVLKNMENGQQEMLAQSETVTRLSQILHYGERHYGN